MCSVKISLCAPLCVCAALVVTKCLVFSIFCAAILFCVVKSQLPLNLLDPLYCCHPPLLHSPADVRQGRLVVPAVYLLPFRGFTWEATAQINSLNSHCSVGTSFSLPHLLAHSLPASLRPLFFLHVFPCLCSFLFLSRSFCLSGLTSICPFLLGLSVFLLQTDEEHWFNTTAINQHHGKACMVL